MEWLLGGKILDVSRSWIFPPGKGGFDVTMNFLYVEWQHLGGDYIYEHQRRCASWRQGTQDFACYQHER